jgi:hypothetical protein
MPQMAARKEGNGESLGQQFKPFEIINSPPRLTLDDTAEGADSKGITTTGIGDGNTPTVFMSIAFVAATFPSQLKSITKKRADKVARSYRA